MESNIKCHLFDCLSFLPLEIEVVVVGLVVVVVVFEDDGEGQLQHCFPST